MAGAAVLVRYMLARCVTLILAAAALAPTAALADPPKPDPASPVTRFDATQTEQHAQLDPAVASDPSTSQTIPGGRTRVLAATDWSSGTNRIGIWRTTDGGTSSASWGYQGSLAPPGVVSGSLPAIAWGDPETNAGRLYAGWLGRSSSASAPCDGSSGVYVNTLSSSSSSLTWDAGTRIPATSGSGGQPFAATWPSLAVDASADTSEGQPIVAYEKVTYTGGTCGTGTPTHQIELQSRAVDGNGWGAFALQGVADAYRPDIVAIPGAEPAIAVAYLHDPAGSGASIDVAVCSRTDAVNIGWDCGSAGGTDVTTVSPAGFTPVGPAVQVGSASIAASTAPSIARSPNGALHVTFTGLVNGKPTVFYTYSNPAGTTWSAPVAIPSPAAQLEPSIAIGPGGRADIAYLDWRDDDGTGKFRAYETSFLGDNSAGTPHRGSNVPLTDTTSALPSVSGTGTVGSRIASQTLSATMGTNNYNGHGLAYFPVAGGSLGEGDIYEGDVWHGLSAPTIPTQNAGDSLDLAKNKPTSLASWFVPTDPDGDPVFVSTSNGPANGTLTGTTYTPDLTYAGPDGFTVRATDLYNLAAAAPLSLNVVDQAPTSELLGTVTLLEGGPYVDITFSFSDPDPNDPLTYSLVNLPPALTATVSQSGHFVRIAAPSGARLLPFNLLIKATDTTTPAANAESAIASVGITIQPDLAAPVVRLSHDLPSGSLEKLTATATWPDPARGCLGHTCSLLYHWNYGSTTLTTTANSILRSFPIGYTDVKVWVTVVNYAGGSVPPSNTVSYQVQISADLRGVVQVAGIRRSGPYLYLSVRSRTSWALRLTVRNGGRSIGRANVTPAPGAGGTFGPKKTLRIRLRGVRGHSASLVIDVPNQLSSQPTPTPLRLRVWI